MKLWCDNQTIIYIANNPIFNEKIKHIEVDCYFVREKLEDSTICTLHVKSGNQIENVFTKVLPRIHMNYICTKLAMINIYAPS